MTEQSLEAHGPQHNMNNQVKPYKATARLYWAKSWKPFPVDGKSINIPKGVTGKEGKDPDWGLITIWENARAGSNIAVRADGWVAIDVDEGGDNSLDNATGALGHLPPTYSCTSRGQDSPRRQYFYQVPIGFDATRAEGRFVKEFGPKVDIIHRGHRYAVVAPSVHPETGQEYQWYGPDGQPCEIPSRTKDLPMLPGAWLDFLRAREEAPAVPAGDFYDEAGRGAWTQQAANEEIKRMLTRIRTVSENINTQAGGAMRQIGRFVPAVLTEELALSMCRDALLGNDSHSDSWNVANGKDWTSATLVASSVRRGMQEPYEIISDGPKGEPARLKINSAADSAYWLQEAIGAGPLSGFFLRGGEIVHTPRVNERGYVEPSSEDDDNGPAQIRTVSAAELAAKIQYGYQCFKVVKDKESGEQYDVPALFPLEAARRAVDAPSAMVNLRTLAGITHTPMVRPNGSILEEPGYDPTTRYLFLPGPGVGVARVPAEPSAEDVGNAVALLDYMTAGFPWEGKDDRANYYGLLLTPLLRALAPPPYKAFFIGAHQPGSGKTLLADVARILHGGIFRSDFPQDEKEIKSMTTSLLATTSAPVVHVDNIGGVLRSSYLAGLLTARGELQERELGKSSNLVFTNDRLWVFTGNNPSLGGDLVRRTVMIMIDPNMANPETREFEIKDLPAWAEAHRNEILWALLVMIRAWVVDGRQMAQRAQSDSFATWEATVAGILASCGVPGEFDQQSGQKAAAGGDDDGLASVLEHIWGRYQNQDWTVAMVIEPAAGAWSISDMDWLPVPVLDKLSRSAAAGKKTMGYWLRNRLGRWVSGSDGHSYVIRETGKRHGSAVWRVERTP